MRAARQQSLARSQGPFTRFEDVGAPVDHAPVRPGLVINWQHSPSHEITESAWDALVVVAPFSGAVLVEWVNAERIEPIRDPSPADGT